MKFRSKVIFINFRRNALFDHKEINISSVPDFCKESITKSKTLLAASNEQKLTKEIVTGFVASLGCSGSPDETPYLLHFPNPEVAYNKTCNSIFGSKRLLSSMIGMGDHQFAQAILEGNIPGCDSVEFLKAKYHIQARSYEQFCTIRFGDLPAESWPSNLTECINLGTRPDGICDAAIKEAKESLGYNSISESEHEGTEMDHERSPVIDATQGLNATGGLISSDSVSDESNPCARVIFAENGAIEDDNERENHVTFEDTADVSVLDDDNSLGDNNMADKSVLAKSAQKMRRFLHVASTPVRDAIRNVAPRKGKETIEERNRGSLHEWKPHDQCSRYKRTEYKETNADKANSLLHALSEKDPLRAA